jgi:hypothetical protein
VIVTSGAQSSVSLVIPCRPEYLSLGRLVAGALGAREGWEEEAITDLKVVISEVSSFFLEPTDKTVGEASTGSVPSTSLRLDFEVAAGGWTLAVSNPGSRGTPLSTFNADLSGEHALALTIVRSVTDRVERADDPFQGTVFRVRKALVAAEPVED